MKQILYICDLFTNKSRVVQSFKKHHIKKYKIIDSTEFQLDGNDPIKNLRSIIKEKIDRLDKPTVLIIDSFSILVVASIYDELVKNKYIDKLILINPLGKSFYLRVFTIKNIWLPKNSRNMVYKQMYLFNNMSNISSNESFVQNMRKELSYLKENEHRVNLMFNQILNFKSLNVYFKFLKNNYLIIIYGDKNRMLTKPDIDYFNKFHSKYIIHDSCYYHFWEKEDEIIKIIKEFI